MSENVSTNISKICQQQQQQKTRNRDLKAICTLRKENIRILKCTRDNILNIEI